MISKFNRVIHYANIEDKTDKNKSIFSQVKEAKRSHLYLMVHHLNSLSRAPTSYQLYVLVLINYLITMTIVQHVLQLKKTLPRHICLHPNVGNRVASLCGFTVVWITAGSRSMFGLMMNTTLIDSGAEKINQRRHRSMSPHTSNYVVSCATTRFAVHLELLFSHPDRCLV